MTGNGEPTNYSCSTHIRSAIQYFCVDADSMVFDMAAPRAEAAVASSPAVGKPVLLPPQVA